MATLRNLTNSHGHQLFRSDFIDILVEDLGFDTVSPMFTRLEGLYLQMNENYVPTLDLGKFRKVLPTAFSR